LSVRFAIISLSYTKLSQVTLKLYVYTPYLQLRGVEKVIAECSVWTLSMFCPPPLSVPLTF
jgi:hypothetical protein